jgi:hypothetical protein
MLKYFFALLLLQVVIAKAQNPDKIDRLKDRGYSDGFVTFKDGNGANGLTRYHSAHTVDFISADGKRTRYKAKKVSGFDRAGTRFVTIGRSFYEIIQEGKRITKYKKTVAYRTGTTRVEAEFSPSPMHFVTEIFYIKKNNGELLQIQEDYFLENFSRYFSDCPELSKRIKNKELRYEDLDQIIYVYNYDCK